MLRRCLSFMLTFCLFWQSLAFAGVEVMLVDESEQAHAVMHFEREAHHHDDHGHVSPETDAQAGVQHLMCDACLFALALWPASTPVFLPVGRDALTEFARQEAPPPCLSGLERPPRTLF